MGFADDFSGPSTALDTGLGAGFCLATDGVVLAACEVGGPSFVSFTCEASRNRYAIRRSKLEVHKVIPAKSLLQNTKSKASALRYL